MRRSLFARLWMYTSKLVQDSKISDLVPLEWVGLATILWHPGREMEHPPSYVLWPKWIGWIRFESTQIRFNQFEDPINATIFCWTRTSPSTWTLKLTQIRLHWTRSNSKKDWSWKCHDRGWREDTFVLLAPFYPRELHVNSATAKKIPTMCNCKVSSAK